MSKEVSLKAKVGLVVFGLVLGLAGIEAGLRILEWQNAGKEFDNVDDLRRAMLRPDISDQEQSGSVPLKAIIQPHPDDSVIYDLKPNVDVTFQKVKTTTNSCGMRDLERSLSKPHNTYRIALLGDSFTFGWGVELKDSFAQVLERLLNEYSDGSPAFEVLNFGVPGYSTFQEVETFKRLALDFNPDAVLVYFVENDFGYPFFVRDVHQSGGLLSAVRFAKKSWQKTDPAIEEQRLKLLGMDANSALRELSDITREYGIKLSVAINPRREWKEDRDRLWVLKERRDIQVIRMRRDFVDAVKTREIEIEKLVLPHDPHPSALKHQILAEILAPHYLSNIS